jgi:MFS family permease
MALLAIPWSVKPAFGLLSDFVPLFGSRRRSYLLLANGVAAVSLLLLVFLPLGPGNRWLLFALLLPTTMGIALGDVIVDALMVEKGQPLGLTGRFQSIQWAAANAALLLAGVLGGYISETKLQPLAFAMCSVLGMFAFAVAWRFAGKDRDEHLNAESFRETAAALLSVLRDPLFLSVCALLTLWSFNPVWGSVLYLHMTEGLGFSEQSFGNVTSAFFAGSLIGSVGYGIYCRSVRLSTLLHLSILAAIVSNAIYWQLSSLTSAYFVSVIAGAAYMTGTLIQLDLTARIIPARAAATRSRHGAHQLCWVGIRSLRRMAIRGHEGIV